MTPLSFVLREFFHLQFLRHLGLRLAGRDYALKGGIALRFFHRSARMSEDIDLDVASRVRRATLQRAVDSILGGRAFLAAFAAMGVSRIQFSRPKQTETTQRWKIGLAMSRDVAFSTRVEFSRRRDRIECLTGIPDAGVLNAHKVPPFAVRYYSAHDLAIQKIRALAAPARHAVRDLFDLDHLVTMAGVSLADVRQEVKEDAERAAEKAGRFNLKDFRAQVLPYLPEDLAPACETAGAFEDLKGRVERALIGILP
ncbi:MAG: hypothetical protein A3G34_16195 [Candidatus Lindowbacteria bacterium RIFCSPLOWO2_12_FULL_62_27]|nr:MAG: hypothetical protein A3I06_17015 [Candidatus Lindowbacteria bacterium RIFCSPLOWO2_02_FULL_62_12]OGH59892.1 MAG: hypothetical protein A3G34_16195 [Candidatus Lindowbacteria bacterium RIFCSPLOWO2_12_FULL_62_27]